jgi:hypothetical protein
MIEKTVIIMGMNEMDEFVNEQDFEPVFVGDPDPWNGRGGKI